MVLEDTFPATVAEYQVPHTHQRKLEALGASATCAGLLSTVWSVDTFAGMWAWLE